MYQSITNDQPKYSKKTVQLVTVRNRQTYSVKQRFASIELLQALEKTSCLSHIEIIKNLNNE